MVNQPKTIIEIKEYIYDYYKESKRELGKDYYNNSAALDKIIISISSGGILLTVTFFEKISKNASNEMILILKASWIFLLISIISVIISYKTVEKAAKLADSTLEAWYRTSKEEIEKGTLEPPNIKNTYHKYTEHSNNIAVSTLIIGLVLVAIFAIFSTKPEQKASESQLKNDFYIEMPTN